MNKNLQHLKKINPVIEVKKTDKGYLVTRPWNDETVSFLFTLRTSLGLLSHIEFPNELVAIHHLADGFLEFIYGPVEKKSPEFDRRFTFNYRGLSFDCFFAPISQSLRLLAEHFRPAKTETLPSYRNLRWLSDFLKDQKFFAQFMKDPVAISFFVKGSFKEIDDDFITFSKSLNFYMRYFDRRSPVIIVKPQKEEKLRYKRPCYLKKNDFPNVITSVDIDPIILDIFHVAEETESPRLRFIFYFQILEYCSYYYLTEKLHQKISSTLRSPDVSANTNVYVRTIIEDLKDAFSQHDDSSKMGQVISNCCTTEDIRNEIECNVEYFCKDIEFEGGFVVSSLLKGNNPLDNLSESVLIQMRTNMERIRNVLVHLRESRENKVILPTRKNDKLLMPYLYCVRRLSEIVAIRFRG